MEWGNNILRKKELEDMELLSESSLPFEAYRNCTFLITGATGLVGSLLVKNLLYCNEKFDLHLNVFAVVRNVDKAEKIYSDFWPNSHLQFLLCDLEKQQIQVENDIDYIIHTAAVTQSRILVSKPVETIKLSLNSTMHLLDLAVSKKVKCFLYISSM